MEHNFKIGDRVVTSLMNYGVMRSLEGKICDLDCEVLDCIGIDFDEELEFGHDCNGKAKNLHGFYIHLSCMKLVLGIGILKVKGWKKVNK